jgi:tetratricopeptide (TPR) repeat protein
MKSIFVCLTLTGAIGQLTGCASFSQSDMALRSENRNVASPSQPSSDQLVDMTSIADEAYQRGRHALVNGNTTEAMKQFKLALKMNPQSLDARNGIAVALFELGRVDEALSAITNAKNLAPNDPVVLRNEVRILNALNSSTELTAKTAQAQLPITNALEKSSSIQLTSPGVYTLSLAALPTLALPLKAQENKSPEPTRSIEPLAVALVNKKVVAAKPPVRTNIELLVANGAGKAGLACAQVRLLRVSKTIGLADVNAKCADYRDYKQLQTVLYVKKGVAIDTEALRSVLGPSRYFKVMQSNNLPGTANAQLVIGRDWLAANMRNVAIKQKV